MRYFYRMMPHFLFSFKELKFPGAYAVTLPCHAPFFILPVIIWNVLGHIQPPSRAMPRKSKKAGHHATLYLHMPKMKEKSSFFLRIQDIESYFFSMCPHSILFSVVQHTFRFPCVTFQFTCVTFHFTYADFSLHSKIYMIKYNCLYCSTHSVFP